MKQQQHLAPYKPNVLDPQTQALWDRWCDDRARRQINRLVREINAELRALDDTVLKKMQAEIDTASGIERH
jgi:hypothetical protein